MFISFDKRILSMKFFDFIFEKVEILTNECEYKERCASYRDNYLYARKKLIKATVEFDRRF